jgi:type IV pilus assembly protein PilP
MKTFNLILMTAGLALGSVACDEAPPPSSGKARPKKEAAAPAAPKEAAKPAVVTTVAYAYNPVGKRDPFRSPLDEIRREQREIGVSACNDPLCQWDLEQLRLVAVVTGDSNPIAMVEDPMGRGHIVRRSGRMGKQGGKVTQILRDSVTVTEFITGNDGKVVTNPVSIQLRPDEARDPAYNLLTGRNYGE